MRCTVVSARACAERTPPSNSDISPNSAPGPSTEITDSPVGGLGRDRDAAREHDVEAGGGIALLEDHIAAAQPRERGAVAELAEQLGRQRPEEIGLVEHLLTCRHLAPSRLARRLSERTSSASR